MPPDQLFEFHNSVYAFIRDVILVPLAWPELGNFFDTYNQGRTENGVRDEIITILTAVAAGGNGRDAIPVASAWILHRIAATIFDDIQDCNEPATVWFGNGKAEAMNVAMAMLTAAQTALTYMKAEARVVQRISLELGLTYAALAHGQTQSYGLEQLAVEKYIQTVFKKAANFLGTGMWAGAYLVSPDSGEAEAFYKYGACVGTMSQIIDDCTDVAEDVVEGNFTLPIILALEEQGHAQHTHLVALLSKPILTQAKGEEIAKLVREMGGIRQA
jgi:geranylgeranyl pyrophosphate synthase